VAWRWAASTCANIVSPPQLALFQYANMGENTFALFLGIANLKFHPSSAQPAAIADLAAGFGVETGCDPAPLRLRRRRSVASTI
jgi:hypothetical protein